MGLWIVSVPNKMMNKKKALDCVAAYDVEERENKHK
jgi:hypothetical protein